MKTRPIHPRPLSRRLFGAGGLLCLFWLSGSALFASPESLTLLLKWRHQFQFAGYYAAEAKGYYANEGLSVTILEGGPQLSPISSVLAGAADFGVSDGELVLARMKGAPVVVCAAIFQHSPYVILSRRDRMIRSPADLIGRKVMLSDEQGEAQLRTMLTREGIDSRQVTILKHSWRLDDLIEGRVDGASAYAMVEPEHMRARGVEPSVLRTIDYGVDFYGDTLFTTESQASASRRTDAFVRASLKGWEYALDHPDEIIELILQKEGVKSRGVTREMLRAEAAGMKAFILRDVVPLGHMNPGRWQRIAEAYRSSGQAAASESLEDFVYDPEKARKRWILLAISAVILSLLGGGVALFIGIQTRRRALKDVQVLLERMLDNSPALIFVKDIAGRYLLVNRQFEISFAVSRAHVLGRTATEIFEPDQAQIFVASDRKVIEEGASLFEARTLFATGTEPRTCILSKFPVLDSSGRISGVGGIATDITEIRRAQEKILEQASMLENARDAIIVCDLNDRITYWNSSAERLYGWSSREAVGQTAAELLYEDVNSVEQAFRQVKQTGEWTGELRQVSRTGVELFVDTRWTLVGDEKGNPRSVLSINTDITEKRRLERQFLRSQRLESIGTLAGGIAHDLNNVLTPILLAAELLQSEEASPRTWNLLERIKHSAQRGADMVSQVLTFARGAEGRRAALRIEDLITDVEKIIRDTLPRTIQLSFHAPPGLPVVHGEPTQLHQVLLNLILNARDAVGEKGRITVTARRASAPEHLDKNGAEWVCIDVEDTGSGIPPENLDRVFDPFFTTKAIGAGTGLGLSTSQTIVRDHGGLIAVESSPGQTHFRVFLPGQSGALPEASQIPSDLPQGSGETILLVDDEAMIRDIIGQTLASSGYNPLFASNGAEAVEAMTGPRREIHAVIVDMMMPVMGGADAIRQIRSIRQDIKIIAASGIPTNESAALEAGASAFIAKPYSTETLLCKLRDLLHPG